MRKSLNWVKRVHKRRQTIKYYYKYFKSFQNYKIETLNDGDKSVFALTSIPLVKHIKIRAEANPFDKIYDDYFLQRWIALKSRKVLAINA